MAVDARVAERLRRRIRARNQQLLVDAAVDGAMGVLFTVLTSGVVYALAWFFVPILAGGSISGSSAALWITGIVFVVGLVSAWRQVDPFAGLQRMSGADRLAFAVSPLVSGYVHFNRHSVAGLAVVLLGGPMNLVGALRNWLHRLPSGPVVIGPAAEILAACRPEVDLRKLRADPEAVVLLRRLNLIVPQGESTVVALTDKGRELVSRPGEPASA